MPSHATTSTTRRLSRRIAAASVAGAGALLALASLALGQGEAEGRGGGEDIGERLGELLSSWAQPLFLGIAAIIAAFLLLTQRIPQLAIFMVGALMVGGFVFAPEAVAGTIGDIWTNVTGQ